MDKRPIRLKGLGPQAVSLGQQGTLLILRRCPDYLKVLRVHPKGLGSSGLRFYGPAANGSNVLGPRGLRSWTQKAYGPGPKRLKVLDQKV